MSIEQFQDWWGAIKQFLLDWTPPAAFVSLALSIITSVTTARRERGKNRREEFHRRVATPIETALTQFDDLQDDLSDLGASNKIDTGTLDEAERKARSAQRKLSRALRYAADSEMCRARDWPEVGSKDYDDLVQHLETARSDVHVTKSGEVLRAAEATGRLALAVRKKIEAELTRYT